MAQNYFLVINGKPEGPFNIDQLQEHGIKPTDFVITFGMIDYKEAQEIPELREALGFKKPVVIPQYFGSFDQRLLATAIDWMIITGVCVIPVVAVIFFTNVRFLRTVITLSLFVLIPIVYLIYHIVMEAGPKQATYGKQVLRIKVTDGQGEPINWGQATGRNLAKSLSVVTLGIGYLLSFFNKKQQCLHDIIAGTLVIKDRLF